MSNFMYIFITSFCTFPPFPKIFIVTTIDTQAWPTSMERERESRRIALRRYCNASSQN